MLKLTLMLKLLQPTDSLPAATNGDPDTACVAFQILKLSCTAKEPQSGKASDIVTIVVECDGI